MTRTPANWNGGPTELCGTQDLVCGEEKLLNFSLFDLFFPLLLVHQFLVGLVEISRALVGTLETSMELLLELLNEDKVTVC